MKKTLPIAVIVVLGIIGVFLWQAWFGGVSNAQEFQKGMCYVSWSKNGYGTTKSDESLAKVASLGANWVAILTTWYQETCFATDIFPTEKTPDDMSLIRAIRKAHELKMKVMLKPHLDILDASYGGWRGEIACVKDVDWQKWFTEYRNFILHYAKIADENKVEMFCIGTELTAATLAKPDLWRQLIKEVRKTYKGQLTYAANWNDEYLNIAFWDALDYAGVDAYFPLSDKEKPTYEELMESWKKWAAEIEGWQKKINKPVIFPEIGYHSADFAAKEPWTHAGGTKVDMALQVDCYNAVYDTFWSKKWFSGIYWWDWGTSTQMGGEGNRGYTPQNKPAEGLIKDWYSKAR